ncbi:hypothetical protein F8M41_015881 [Gigaspora margarita]|uniref:Uncharacterized protein n=1 Tax=Gigaspora margarita TaxID=4874 RepID=A0A8H4EN21_GIGMA|nr:hypothetical protein F8M41_015881 [Gigaspora margarita]
MDAPKIPLKIPKKNEVLEHVQNLKQQDHTSEISKLEGPSTSLNTSKNQNEKLEDDFENTWKEKNTSKIQTDKNVT